jgi:hypothetical protein
MTYLEDATGTESTSAGSGEIGGFFHNVTSIIAGILGFTFFWPMLVPFHGTGVNYTVESSWNWVLEIIWLLVLVWIFAGLARRRRAHRSLSRSTRL